MVIININRITEGHTQTLGHASLFCNNIARLDFVTLELSNRHNQTNISSIPTGKYKGKVIVRPNGDKAIILQGVKHRTAILIHKGNFHTDVKGCILVGSRFADINKDGYADVIESTLTIDKILSFLKLGEELQININKLLC